MEMAAGAPLRTFTTALLLVCPGASHGQSPETSFYANGRYGVALYYPAVLEKAKVSPANGDGQTFTIGAVTLIVFGSYDVLTPTETMKMMSETDIMYTYKEELSDGLVLSGLQANKIVYERCKRMAETLGCFRITYPKKDRVFWDKAVIQMSKSLRINPP